MISFAGRCRPQRGRGAQRAPNCSCRARRCPSTAEEEFYHADLIGLEAQDSEGRVLGKVAAIHNFGAGDVIEIARADGDSVLLAFTRETVPTIDIAGGRIVVRCRRR